MSVQTNVGEHGILLSNSSILPPSSSVIVFSASVCFSFFFFGTSESLLPVSLVLGSKRISDSEVSDYDCEDGVGVVSGECSHS